jgi:uncharacterized membrane protein
MLARLKSLLLRVRGSLWALPLAVAAVCAVLALVALDLDLPWTSEVAWLYSGSASQAPEFAASLVGAMITLTALAFSITMVVLTLAAQQLGPRLIQIFMRDRGTQATLGLFIGTVVYLLLVLRALGGSSEGQTPALAITGGTALVLASVLALLFFVHSLAQSIVADNVIVRVGQALEEAILETFPEEAPPDSAPAPEAGTPVRLKSRGYVQQIDYEGLVRAAKRHNATIVLSYHVGAHVVDGEVDARVNAADDLSGEITKYIVIGQLRSNSQDPEWSQRQLVEIALRALSSGINDVFTALAVIDRLSRALALLQGREEAPQTWRDEDGVPRVFGPAPTFDLLIAAAYDQIREAGVGHSAVVRRLAENLRKLAEIANGRQVHALERQFELLDRAARRIVEVADRLPIDAAIRAGREALRRAEGCSPRSEAASTAA